MTIKQLLMHQTAQAFDARPDMSLAAALKEVTAAAAIWHPHADAPSIEQLVRHVAWAKMTYCCTAFNKATPIADPNCDDVGDTPGISPEFPCGCAWAMVEYPGIEGALQVLDRSHRLLLDCLESCDEESLGRPLPHRHGRTSAAHFFTVLLTHDAYHAGQIRTRRTVWRDIERSPI